MENSEYEGIDLRKFFELESQLNRIQDLDILLERILLEARKMVSADAGSIYIQKTLPPGQKLIFRVFTVPITTKTVSGYTAATGDAVNVPDVYNLPKQSSYGFDTSYDKKSGYRTQSVLCVPLKTNTGELLGVLQLINKKDPAGSVVPFTSQDELVALHFGTNVTVALQRAQMTRTILLRMISMAEMRDPKETGPHVNRVAGYAMEIYERWATKTGIHPSEIEKTRDTLRMAAMLHDVGKVAISDTILKKPSRFTDEEYSVMKSHTYLGARLFKDKQSDFDDIAGMVALTHHENWDGTGYPGHVDLETGAAIEPKPDGSARGRLGPEIPLFGRIVSLADVYDALSCRRVYKAAWKEDEVYEEIRKLAGVKFDAELVEAFFEVLPNILTIANKYPDGEH
jgi:HD-GYP domain-containing protein (c-di-GMP phosphodiesterase class II)